MRIMEITPAGEEEERIAALENRVRNLDALVRGLIAEMLDIKTVAMAFSRQDGERTSQEPEHGTVVATPSASPPVAVAAAGSTVVRSRGSRQKDLPATPAEPRMVRIMQADGTMKMEPRYGT
jgi:hypothetical protein